MRTGILTAALAALIVQPGVASAKKRPPQPAAPVQLPYQSANLPSSGEVRAFYATYRGASLWFASNALKPGARELVTILQRSPLDGIPMGPQYAAQVQAALNQAATGSPQAIAFAEHTLSEALVLYAQAMARPSRGYIYAYDYLKPKIPAGAQVLQTAMGSPSLQAFVHRIANPNSIYTSIRDAAWRQMQASGSTAVDSRAVANLDRARIFPATGRFVLVDSATQRLFMYENGVSVDSMKVVVGDPWELKLPTPMIASTMYYVVHNPYWNVPHHLVQKMARDRISKEGVSYLKSRGYEVMKDWTAASETLDAANVDWKAVADGSLQVRIRQKPRGDNSMGDLKFPFDNPEGIFLHDTPMRQYFKLAVRAKSNGCVRLEDAHRFARWLLRREPVKPNNGAEQFEQMAQGVPIFTTYITAQVENGTLAYVDDIYGWDAAGGAAQQVAATQ